MRKVSIVSAFAVLALIALASAIRAQSSTAGQITKEVQMTAKKYEFSPSTVEVNVGTRIIFKITALDREHGFEIQNVKNSCVQIKKGETVTVEYLAEKAGTVEFKCCVFCGTGHRGMKGKIIIH
ncbi:MAG: cupredoxin domain-containing protein [Acidobacteriia bacterium]|nr:cupredoxin domain-containing protein [Terriglobia bacterium]